MKAGNDDFVRGSKTISTGNNLQPNHLQGNKARRADPTRGSTRVAARYSDAPRREAVGPRLERVQAPQILSRSSQGNKQSPLLLPLQLGPKDLHRQQFCPHGGQNRSCYDPPSLLFRALPVVHSRPFVRRLSSAAARGSSHVE